MPSSSSIIIALFLLFLDYHSYNVQCRREDSKLTTYIIHVRPIDVTDASTDSLATYYKSFLPSTTEESAEDRLVHFYTEVFSGFAARLTDREVEDMARKEGFVRAYRDRIIPLHTTRTPAFLGLRSGTGAGVWNASRFGEGVVIGLVDTGITPDHPSFNDEGMSPPPEKWKGACEFKAGCNNKLIGARAYGQSAGDPSDGTGHGSHTASTAAGSAVSGVDAFELGSNVASGIAPKAHLAMYKVCQTACNAADIVAGIDDAVKDGVDVMSISLGGWPAPYNEDPVAISTFGAIRKGIVVVCSAGNDGPFESSVVNEAPWMLTVAASSVDRSFRSTVRLGNKKIIDGETLYQPANFTSGTFPLVFPDPNDFWVADCILFSNTSGVNGSIVACQSGGAPVDEQSRTVKESGGVGMIHINSELEGYTIGASDNALPTVQVSYADGLDVVSYINSTKNSPTATITFGGTVLGTSPSPTVAYFSARGPGKQSSILKPDITAPGLNILAAWNTKVDSSKGKFGYNVVSGTSMSAPHVSGIAALLKSLHPDWSPAAIKSAIMTTSDTDDRDGNPIKDEKHKTAVFYQMGCGHVNPTKAAEPGLVYDLDVDDYVAFLCGMGLGDSGVGTIVGRWNASCSGVKNVTEYDLNYPSITIPLASGSTTVTRTVMNVGAAKSTYSLAVDVPRGVSVSVKPETLRFSKVNEKKTFRVTVSASRKKLVEGNLKWVSGKVVVRSPLIITNNVKSKH